MNNQDPIADMLTRIRNANRVGRRMVLIPKSKICLGIAQVLKDEGYIEEFDVIDDATAGPDPRQAQVLDERREGHPRDRPRQQARLPRLPRRRRAAQVLNGMGIAVVSTSKGVMSDRKAREQNVGGELLCTVS